MSKTSGKAFFWTLLGFVVVGGGAFIYFQYIKKPKTDSTSTDLTSGVGEVGKNAYATRPDTSVFNNDMSIYKKANEGEWLGTIKAVVMKAGHKYYQSTGDKFFVAQGVKLK